MKTVIVKQERCELSEFADKHGLVMEVREIANSSYPKYVAYFIDVKILAQDNLRLCYGYGDTINGAIKSYVRAINGGDIVLNAYSADRKQVKVPILYARNRIFSFLINVFRRWKGS